MKTSHVLIILILVILGLVLFSASSDDNGTDVTEDQSETTDANNDTADNMNEDDEDATQTEGTDQSGASDDSENGASVEAGLETTAFDKGGMEDGADEKTFAIDGFDFGYSDEEIRVKKGDTVTINLTSTDGFHDWVVDEFSASTEKVNTGESTSVTFVADKAGTFEYYCSVGSHRQAGMVGKLIVE